LTPEVILDGGVRYGVTNKGNYPNDVFDESLYNADFHVLRHNEEWVSWCVIVGRSNLEDGHEVFVKYGRDHWCYLGNINTLSLESRLKCMEFYKISEADLFDCEDEDDQPLAQLVPQRITVTCSSKDSPRKVKALQKAEDAKKKASKK